jgi:hypothetical protein
MKVFWDFQLSLSSVIGKIKDSKNGGVGIRESGRMEQGKVIRKNK